MAVRTRTLDQTERGIVRLLQEDGRMSTIELSRRLASSEPTIRKKLSKMIEEGVITIRGVVSPNVLGYSVGAIIGFVVERGHVDEVANILGKYNFVDSVNVTAGPNDITVKAYFESVDDVLVFVNETLSSIKSIRDTDSTIIFKEVKYFGLKGVIGVELSEDGIVATDPREMT